ncbi:hypothetical protein PRBEI_2000093400 [Prionailurus iriomotensis]
MICLTLFGSFIKLTVKKWIRLLKEYTFRMKTGRGRH